MRLSNQKPGSITGASGRGGARRSRGAGQGRMGRRRVDSPKSATIALRDIIDNTFERIFKSANEDHPMYIAEETKRSVDSRLTID